MTDGGARSSRLPASGLAADILAAYEASPGGGDPLHRFADAAAAVATPAAPAATRTSRHVIFELAGQRYGVPAAHTHEVLRVGPISRVPGAPRYVRGVTSIRGRVIVVVEVRQRLGLAALELDDRARLLVVDSAGRRFALLVDAVTELASIDEASIAPPPADVALPTTAYVWGVVAAPTNLTLLVDLDLLVRADASVDAGGSPLPEP